MKSFLTKGLAKIAGTGSSEKTGAGVGAVCAAAGAASPQLSRKVLSTRACLRLFRELGELDLRVGV